MLIPSTIKSIIFDYDGVLGDSTPFNTYACKEAAKLCGIDLDPEVYAHCSPGGATIQDIASCIVTHYGKPELVTKYIEHKKSFDKEYVKEVKVLSNVERTVSKLSGIYPLAINTGTRHILVDSFVHKYGLAKYFQAIVAAEDIKQGKPHPESYILAASILNTPPESCMVVEDGASGIKSAKSAGCFVVGITTSIGSSELKKLGCDQIIDDLSELTIPTSV
jgi:HAD superfamily hydrolase (TIGR01509 family)